MPNELSFAQDHALMRYANEHAFEYEVRLVDAFADMLCDRPRVGCLEVLK
jgi:hypothetical protein